MTAVGVKRVPQSRAGQAGTHMRYGAVCAKEPM